MITLLVLLLSCVCQEATGVTLQIDSLKEDHGDVWIGVFISQEGFSTDSVWLSAHIPRDSVKGRSITHTLSLPPGTYGISVLDDKNLNEAMDFNFLGIPKEGFGFSDYYHTALRKPVFSDFSFVVDNADKTVLIRMKYY